MIMRHLLLLLFILGVAEASVLPNENLDTFIQDSLGQTHRETKHKSNNNAEVEVRDGRVGAVGERRRSHPYDNEDVTEEDLDSLFRGDGYGSVVQPVSTVPINDRPAPPCNFPHTLS